MEVLLKDVGLFDCECAQGGVSPSENDWSISDAYFPLCINVEPGLHVVFFRNVKVVGEHFPSSPREMMSDIEPNICDFEIIYLWHMMLERVHTIHGVQRR
jgi:hypothetical protein